MPIFEDEQGTYIMNSKDLRAVHHVEQLMKIGIDSLKIEGRTKSHYYTARTSQVYRQAIDDVIENKAFNKDLFLELDKLANRGYTEGFFRRHASEDYQNYEHASSTSRSQEFVGEILEYQNGSLKVNVKNRFRVGDSLELVTPQGNFSFILEHLTDKNDEMMTVAPGSGYVVFIHNAPIIENINYGLLTRII